MIECPRCNSLLTYEEFIKHTKNSIPYNCIKYCYEKNLKKDIKKRNIKIVV